MEKRFDTADRDHWIATSFRTASLSAFGIVGFLYLVSLTSTFPVSSKLRDIGLFLFSVSLLPVLAAIAQSRVPSGRQNPQTSYFEIVNLWTAFALLVGLSSLTVGLWKVGADTAVWLKWALLIARALAAANLLAQVIGEGHARIFGKPLLSTLNPARQAAMFLVLFSLCAILLFNIKLNDPFFNSFFRIFADPPFLPRWIGLAATAGLLMIGITACFAYIEDRLASGGPARLERYRRAALVVAIMLLFVLFFDFKLELEPLHYLTNVGPALHVLNGGTLMVDTFSQYGPGPVVATLLAFFIGPHTLGTAQIMTQLFNLAFCAIWLICLFRMTRWKIAALLLGLMTVGLIFATWAYGTSSINIAPSVLGFRFWPAIAMCLAISCLQPGVRSSRYTFAVSALAGLWSMESVVATLAVHESFILFIDLQDRSARQLIRDGVKVIAPLGASVSILSVYTLVSAGALPDYRIYFQYLTAYNPLSDFWAHPTSPLFLAWMTMLLAVFLVFARAWFQIFAPAADGTKGDSDLFHKYVPMATLTVAMSTYYVSRSYDYTLLIGALPFAALAIPTLLRFEFGMFSVSGPARILGLVPVIIAVPAITFGLLALGRPDGPNSFFLQECRDHGHCSAGSLMAALNKRLRVREVFDHTENPLADRWFGIMQPGDLVRSAVAVIETQAKDDKKINVLLGENMADELTLLHTGKWQRWPISFAFTDGLNSALAERIAAAPIHLRPGEFVLIRRDEARLPFIESSIIRRIRQDVMLCVLPPVSSEIIAYRVASATGCAHASL